MVRMAEPMGERQGDVACELVALSKYVEELHGAIDLVLDRLAPILRDEPATKDAGGEDKRLVPLAEDIHRQSAKVSQAVERLRFMLSRVEL